MPNQSGSGAVCIYSVFAPARMFQLLTGHRCIVIVVEGGKKKKQILLYLTVSVPLEA
jgi:hypothetical protein